MTEIAIQGIGGSFHDIAAHQYFKDEKVETLHCNTFEDVFACIASNPSVLGCVAIENTIAGSLLHNYELLRESGAIIIGEHKLHIEHSICCLPEDDWNSITEVHSHPVALMQCRKFLASHPTLKAVEAEDTAGAAYDIKANNNRSWAAICNAEAARLYGMKVLEEKIEDNKHNFTRFLLLAHKSRRQLKNYATTTNKASMVFSLPHEEGSLSKVLAILSFYNVNMTKIQSLPIIGREWEYMFYVDVTYNDLIRYRQSIDAIIPLTNELRILGEYCYAK
ncbi:MAG: prephenate dehydratase [Prevotella sp.]|nr:prephenate dehydratase [Prevotella sp.]MDY3852151.1 prephenate dehydratase domain-containing protein [Prevotella sp.]